MVGPPPLPEDERPLVREDLALHRVASSVLLPVLVLLLLVLLACYFGESAGERPRPALLRWP